MVALLWRWVGVRAPSVAQAGRPPICQQGSSLHALVPAYPVGLVSSGPRGSVARLAVTGRAIFFLLCALRRAPQAEARGADSHSMGNGGRVHTGVRARSFFNR